MSSRIKNFTSIDSVYGPFVVNRYCAYQAEALIKTGYPHIQGELSKMLAIATQLPQDCVVVDAGANIGLVSVPLAHAVKARGGTVHAFEAQRMMYYALCGTAALNDLDNLYVWNKAVGAKADTLRLEKVDYAKPRDFGMVSFVDRKGEADGEAVEVVTIDSLKLPRLDFFKIDVEGMEIDVLRGAKKSIKAHLPWCWVEYWKVGAPAIKAEFAGLDYKFFLVDKLNMLCAPAAKLEGSPLKISAPEA